MVHEHPEDESTAVGFANGCIDVAEGARRLIVVACLGVLGFAALALLALLRKPK